MHVQLMSLMGAYALAAGSELEAPASEELMMPTEATGPTSVFHEAMRRMEGGVRRRTTRVAPAPETEAAYVSHVDPGRGWDHNTGYWRGNAMEEYTGDIKSEQYSLGMTSSKKVIKSMEEFGEAMRATASVKGSGWGMKMQVDASFERDISMHSTDALFLFHGDKELGYEGWNFSEVPPLTQAAQDALCSQGTLTHENFEQEYGSYYVMGVRKAIALDIWIKIKTSTSSSDQKVTASIEGAWNGFGKSVSGSATFAHELHAESSYSNVEVRSKAYGVDNTWFPNADLENVDDVINEFKTMSGGSGIAHILYRYDDHPDFQRIVKECGSTVDSLQADVYWMEMITDAAVTARLMAEQMMDGTYEECRYQLGIDAYTVYDTITQIPVDQIGLDKFVESERTIFELKEKWNQDDNSCKMACWSKPTFCNLYNESQCNNPTNNAYWGGDSRTEGQCIWVAAKNMCQQKPTLCEFANQEQCTSSGYNAVFGVNYTSAKFACIWANGNQQENLALAAHSDLTTHPRRR